MNFNDYERDLKDPACTVDFILNRYYHSGQSQVFHGSDPKIEPAFKVQIGAALEQQLRIRFHPLQIIICGSAHLGFSPTPGENFGNSFNPRTSDIDVAIISPELFERWWTELRSCDLTESKHREIAFNVYRGLINPHLVWRLSDIGQQWWNLFNKLPASHAKSVRGRVYRDYWSMQEYHRRAIVEARNELAGRRA
jgi:hypothetical protein